MATPTPAQRAADKHVPILAIMAKLGRQPIVTAAGGNYYFLSPFRDEKTPSFVVSEPKNVWADFGEVPAPGKKVAGGDVLSLIMRLTGFELPVARLTLRAWAADLPAVAPELPLAPSGRTVASGKLTFDDVRTEPLTWKALTDYLTGRGINWGLVQRSARTLEHLQQIFYRVRGGVYRPQPYFALGWKTDAGWEVRSKSFQGTIGGKGLTWLVGSKPGFVVFEGFMDYLAALTYYKRSCFEPTVLVLNSVNLLSEAYPRLLANNDLVHWYGDNDAAGLRALHQLRQVLSRKRVVAHNEKYRGYKDFNDFLTKTPPTKPLPARGDFVSERSKTAKWWLYAVFNHRQPGSRMAEEKKRQCTFYSYSNEPEGLELLRVLRNRIGHQLAYFRLCERTQGRDFKILEYAGFHEPVPVRPGYVPPVFDESAY